MCGIAGVAGPGVTGVRVPVERMLAALVHRGPDSSGVTEGDGWAIGARRLAIIDLETGDQPVGNEGGEVQAVLNGEIYNYRELREGLAARGHRLRSAGDTEVLVHLWEELGPEMLGRLRGMFALAVFDTRQRTLFLARDRVGKKPLYWARLGGRLLFASELKALRAALPARPALDRRALAAFLAFGFVPEGQCILQGVEKLPPAHWLRLDALTGEVRQRRYWALPGDAAVDVGPAAAAATLLGRLEEAVALRLRADVPLAV
ncbi:MAG: asnB 5, partial [Acidobacteria bacterium]|nr:asnB 5 [Acidobacteriota bacterium]